AQNTHHHPVDGHVELAAGLCRHGMNAANHANARDQHDYGKHQHPGKKALQHAVHQRHAIRRLQTLSGRAQEEMGKKHAAHPNDDGQKVQKFEANKKHGVWSVRKKYPSLTEIGGRSDQAALTEQRQWSLGVSPITQAKPSETMSSASLALRLPVLVSSCLL